MFGNTDNWSKFMLIVMIIGFISFIFTAMDVTEWFPFEIKNKVLKYTVYILTLICGLITFIDIISN